ncbi:MAG: hypothetical protein NTX79_06990 [Candidatus Micrarchaeota archaeon]|nr:hypothetical protein [Candidatus Micrarchaeota archaeon]
MLKEKKTIASGISQSPVNAASVVSKWRHQSGPIEPVMKEMPGKNARMERISDDEMATILDSFRYGGNKKFFRSVARNSSKYDLFDLDMIVRYSILFAPEYDRKIASLMVRAAIENGLAQFVYHRKELKMPENRQDINALSSYVARLIKNSMLGTGDRTDYSWQINCGRGDIKCTSMAAPNSVAAPIRICLVETNGFAEAFRKELQRRLGRTAELCTSKNRAEVETGYVELAALCAGAGYFAVPFLPHGYGAIIGMVAGLVLGFATRGRLPLALNAILQSGAAVAKSFFEARKEDRVHDIIEGMQCKQ